MSDARAYIIRTSQIKHTNRVILIKMHYYAQAQRFSYVDATHSYLNIICFKLVAQVEKIFLKN